MNTKKQISNTKKETPNSKLQKSSVIFMQLGLIIALLVVYITLEHESFIYKTKIKKMAHFIDIEIDAPDKIKIIKDKVIPKVIKVTKKPIIKQIPKVIEKIKIVKNDVKVKVTPLATTEVEPDDKVKVAKTATVSKVVTPKIVKPVAPTSFEKIEIAPSFFGCSGSNEAKKKCFNKKIALHIQKHFNIDLAQDLGLSSGKKRIRVAFIINEYGDVVNIKVAAPHKKLESEAKRIMMKLPKFRPGIQNDAKVKVKYNLPINFKVED